MADHVVSSTDGTRITCGVSGSGPPLVLVHGTSVERFSFRFVEPLLVDGFTLYAVDRRGRGESGDSGDGYRIEQEFADIAAVVDSIGGPAGLLGHSYGATVALGAARLAGNLRKLVLYEPAPGVPQVPPELLTRLDELLARDAREELLSTFLLEVGLDENALAQLQASPVWPGRVAAAHTIVREIRAEQSYEPHPEMFASMRTPTLLLLGSESPDWAKQGTEVAAAMLPTGRVSILEGQGHVAIMTAPELIAEEVRRFVVDERPSGSAGQVV